MDAVEGKNKKEITNKSAKLLADLMDLPVEQRFRPFRPPTGG